MSKVFVLLYVFYDMKDPEVLGVYSSKELALEAFRARLTRKAARIKDWMSPEEAEARRRSVEDIPEFCRELAEEGQVSTRGERYYYLQETNLLLA